MSKYLKNFVFLLLTLFVFTSPLKARVLELSSMEETPAEQVRAEVYKPSKLIIGQKTGFIIKADPNSFVALTIAADEEGEDLLARIDGVIGEKGVIELFVELPDDEKLTNKILFFAVGVWKNEDMSDLRVARVVDIDGRTTMSNALVIAPKPDSRKLPGFGTAMPGVGDVSRTMDAIHNEQDITPDEYYYNKPLILRNLRTPDSLEKDDD